MILTFGTYSGGNPAADAQQAPPVTATADCENSPKYFLLPMNHAAVGCAVGQGIENFEKLVFEYVAWDVGDLESEFNPLISVPLVVTDSCVAAGWGGPFPS